MVETCGKVIKKLVGLPTTKGFISKVMRFVESSCYGLTG
jgi:hypothetical protein